MLYLIIFFALLPGLAIAEPNIPTIILTERLMIYLFVLIVGLEAWVILKYLPSAPKKLALLISLKANILTTFIIIPLVWAIWLAIIINIPNSINLTGKILDNIIRAPWIASSENLLLAEWIMAPVYFLASFYTEFWFCRKKLSGFPRNKIKKAFFLANLYSYLAIMFIETIYQFAILPYKADNPYLF